MEACIVPTLWVAAFVCLGIFLLEVLARVFGVGQGDEKKWLVAAEVLLGAVVVAKLFLCLAAHT